jgi:hypothetical protein
MVKKFMVLVLVLGVLGGVLAGCGSSDNGGGTAGTSTTGTTGGTASTASSTTG